MENNFVYLSVDGKIFKGRKSVLEQIPIFDAVFNNLEIDNSRGQKSSPFYLDRDFEIFQQI